MASIFSENHYKTYAFGKRHLAGPIDKERSWRLHLKIAGEVVVSAMSNGFLCWK